MTKVIVETRPGNGVVSEDLRLTDVIGVNIVSALLTSLPGR